MDPINEITKDRSFDECRNVGFVTVQKGEVTVSFQAIRKASMVS